VILGLERISNLCSDEMQKKYIEAQSDKNNPRMTTQYERDPKTFDALIREERRRRRILSDPTSVESQRAIEEDISQENIFQNMNTALETNPESFGQVDMLYIQCTVDKHVVTAFVDTGAQTTISTKRD